MKSPRYTPRFYRRWPETGDLQSFRVQVSESDLHIRAETRLEEPALHALLDCRCRLESYMREHPDFFSSMRPMDADPFASSVVRSMAEAARRADVGPMAAVAGAVADFVGCALYPALTREIIVENGGDVFLAGDRPRKIGIYPGPGLPLLYVEVRPSGRAAGICTSSGTLGHSRSFGKADSVTILADTAALADAAATAVANRVQTPSDIQDSLDAALYVEGVRGVLIVAGGSVGIKGEITLTE